MESLKGPESPKKPNLRRAPANNKSRLMILTACMLAVAYMYPTILKPLFGVGQSRDYEENKRKLSEINEVLAKHRPSNMPDWSSPFAPKNGD